MRLSMSSLAGIVRTLVAVGTVRLAVMLVAVRAAAPRSRTAFGGSEPSGRGAAVPAGAAVLVGGRPAVLAGPAATAGGRAAVLPGPAVLVGVAAAVPARAAAAAAPFCSAGPAAGIDGWRVAGAGPAAGPPWSAPVSPLVSGCL